MISLRLSSNPAIAATVAITMSVHPGLAQSGRTFAPAGEIRAEFSLAGAFLPLWSGHSLLQVEKNYSAAPVLYAIDKNGNREDIPLAIPKAFRIGVWSASAGRDGALAVLTSALSDDSRGALVLNWISPDRTRRTMTRIDRPYIAERVVIAADGTIWTAGESVDNNVKAPVLWRFDSSGKQLGAYVPGDTLRGRYPAEHSFLVSSRDRIGWYTGPNEYIEFAFDGTMIGRFPGFPPAEGVRTEAAALSDDNDVLICNKNSNTHTYQLYALDRVTRAWDPVTFTDKSDITLISGFEGTTLVTIPEGKVIRFYRDASPVKKP
jgi:hypothetical protein